MKYRIYTLLAAAALAVTLSVSFFSAEAQELKEGTQGQVCGTFTSSRVLEDMEKAEGVMLINKFVDEEARNFIIFSNTTSFELDLILIFNKNDRKNVLVTVFSNGCAIISSAWPTEIYNNTMERMGMLNRKTMSGQGPWPMFEVESN